MSLPRPARGMLVELHGGRRDGQRVPYVGRHLRVPVLRPVNYMHPDYEIPATESFSVEAYTLRQSVKDGHWVYVLD